MIFPDGDDRKTRGPSVDAQAYYLTRRDIMAAELDAAIRERDLWKECADEQFAAARQARSARDTVAAELDAAIREREELRLKVWKYEAGPAAVADWKPAVSTTRLAVWRAPSGSTWIDVAGSPDAERTKGDSNWTFVGYLAVEGG